MKMQELKDAKLFCASKGYTLQYNKETGKYRVNAIGNTEKTAYYTSALLDAIEVVTVGYINIDDYVALADW